tara:strand:+ start:573 stop:1373 length:801 start_codon:yes stop_codon:yes gene_type:complete
MALGNLLKPVVWTLTSEDTGDFIEGQFRPVNLTENISATYAEQTTLGLGQPVLQFINNQADTISFTAKVWAYSQGLLGTGLGKNSLAQDDIEEVVEAIKELPRPSPDLGRPEVYILTVGATFSQRVVVQSVGGIRYDNMRPSQGGSMRGVTFEIACIRYVPIGEATATPAESLIYRAKTGDFYESITAAVYGRAILGEALRRRNPDRRELQEGDPVHVPPERILDRELTLKPQSTALKRTKAQQALQDSFFDKRAGPWVTVLPEGY